MLDAAGCDVILVETVGVGQSEVEIASQADTSVVLLAPGMGDGIQAAKAGILEIGDVYVVNKADRDGADATARELNHMLGLGEARGPGDWRPPIVKTVAARAEGVDEVVEAWRSIPGLDGGARGPRRAPQAPARPARWRPSPSPRCANASATCTGDRRLSALAERIVAGELDPYRAADDLVEGLTQGRGRRRCYPTAACSLLGVEHTQDRGATVTATAPLGVPSPASPEELPRVHASFRGPRTPPSCASRRPAAPSPPP